MTNSGGEIVVLGSANYGAVTIDKSVTINTQRGASSTISLSPSPSHPDDAGIRIAGTGIDVTLKGLTLVGLGATADIANNAMTGIGYAGVEIAGGASDTTTVDATDTRVSCAIPRSGFGFLNNASASTVGRMFLTRVTATNCLMGASNSPQSPAAGQVVAIRGSTVTGNYVGFSNFAGNTFDAVDNKHVARNGTNLAIDKSVTINTPPGIYAGISVFPSPANTNDAGVR